MSDINDQVKTVDADLEMLDSDFNHPTKDQSNADNNTDDETTKGQKSKRKFNWTGAVMLILLLILIATGSVITFLDNKTINKYIDLNEVTNQLNGISEKLNSLSTAPTPPQPKVAAPKAIVKSKIVKLPPKTSMISDTKVTELNKVSAKEPTAPNPSDELLKNLEQTTTDLSQLIVKANQTIMDNESDLSQQIIDVRQLSMSQLNGIKQTVFQQASTIRSLTDEVNSMKATQSQVKPEESKPNQQVTANTQALKGLSLLITETTSQLAIIKSAIDGMSIEFTKLSKRNANFASSLSDLKADILVIKDNNSNKIDNFKEYEMIGFDSNKLYIWIKDINQNVIKIKQGDFLPEYGTVISVTEDGQIITKLGLVKIKADTK